MNGPIRSNSPAESDHPNGRFPNHWHARSEWRILEILRVHQCRLGRSGTLESRGGVVNRFVLVAVVVAWVGLARIPGADPPTPDVPSLIRQLRDNDFDARLAAEEALIRLGAAAVAQLRDASKSDDPEIAFRAERALKAIEFAIPPGTPPNVAQLLRRYRNAEPNEQQMLRFDVFLAAAQAGKPGVPVMRVLGAGQIGDKTDTANDFMMAVRRAIPQHLFAGREEEAEAILEALLEFGPLPDVAADYAIFQFDRGRATDILSRFEPLQEGTTRQAEVARWVVLHLYRARGETDKALKALDGVKEVAVRNRFRQVLLADAVRWGELADQITDKTGSKERLTLLRLSGRDAELNTQIGLLRSLPREQPKEAEPTLRVVEALLMVGRPVDAERVAETGGLGPAIRLQLAAMQFRLTDALALPGGKDGVAALKAQKFEDWQAWQSERAKLLARLGRSEEAANVIEEVAAAPAPVPRPAGVPGLPAKPLQPGMAVQDPPEIKAVRDLIAAGLTDRAFEYAGTLIDKPPRAGGANWYQLLTALYGLDVAKAHAWWYALRTSDQQSRSLSETLTLVRRLLAGTATKEEYAAGREAMKTTNEMGVPLGTGRRLAIIEAAIIAGQPDEAERPLQEEAEATVPSRPNVPRAVKPWLDWGKYLTARGRHKEAADVFFRGWERHPDAASLLYHSGRALLQAGDAVEGKRRLDVAFRIPLGSEPLWYEFTGELIDGGGRLEDRKRAADTIGRLFWGQMANRGLTPYRRALAYRWARAYPEAARAHDVAMYAYSTEPNVRFVLLSQFLRSPAWSDAYRAIALAEAGKPKEAIIAARAYLRVSPGEVTFVTELVPALDKIGAKAEADEVFRTTWDAMRAVLKDYPDSAFYHNQAAWLAASARRELDTALEDAKRATALSPSNTSYQDTLAEVHFRRGDRAAAVAIMKTLVERTIGRRPYFQHQLERFQTGDVASPPPDEL